MSGMQKVLLVGVITSVLLCAGGGLYGYFRLWPHIPETVSAATEHQISTSVQSAVSMRIAATGHDPQQVVLYAQDFDFNDYVDGSGESGLDYSDGEVTIYNSVVTIDGSGIDISLADMHIHAEVAIIDGRFELLDPQVDNGLSAFFLKPEAIVNGIEQGVNEALADVEKSSRLAAASEGYLTIRFGDIPDNPLCAAGGLGCEPAISPSTGPVRSLPTPV
jgi:hypothetical protein